MSPSLVVEHLDVIEQPRLGLAAAVEPVGQLARERGEEGFHHGVVVVIPATAHRTGETVLVEHALIVVARICAALIGVMQQAGLGTPPFYDVGTPW